MKTTKLIRAKSLFRVLRGRFGVLFGSSGSGFGFVSRGFRGCGLILWLFGGLRFFLLRLFRFFRFCFRGRGFRFCKCRETIVLLENLCSQFELPARLGSKSVLNVKASKFSLSNKSAGPGKIE